MRQSQIYMKLHLGLIVFETQQVLYEYCYEYK